MNTTASFSDRWRYRLDNFLARGSGPLFLALALFFVGSLAALALLRFVLNLIDPDLERSFVSQVWVIWLEMTDPGNMNQDNVSPTIYKVPAMMAGVIGVVLFSMLIAFLTTTIDGALRGLRKGRSRVMETGHTLILGWGPRVIEILQELVIANESRKDPSIVILSDQDKEYMDDYLRTYLTNRRNTRLVTRNGSTSSLKHLEHVNAAHARSAIVLARCTASASAEAKLSSDAHVIKSVLALQTHAGEQADIHIVAEIFDRRNRELLEDAVPTCSTVIDAEESLAKLIVQTSRTSGLSVVYSELLSFDGCEIYFYRAKFNDTRFGDLQYRFADGVPIGIRKANGKLFIKPAADVVVGNDDDLVIVATDDAAIELSPAAVAMPAAFKQPHRRLEQRRERMLIAGWSPKAPTIIGQYSEYVLPGSQVDVMLQQPPAEVRETVERLGREHPALTVRLIEKLPLLRQDIESVDPLAYDTVLILQQRIEAVVDPERTDSESIVVLLHLRRLVKQARAAGKEVTTKVITEVLDSENQSLIKQAGVNDFIISNRLVSMIFAQISEEPRIKQVYDDLFEERGAEIYVKPASLYFDTLPITCSFADLMSVAQSRDNEVCLGYKLARDEDDASRNFGVKLVPPKDTKITLDVDDALVVVADDDR